MKQGMKKFAAMMIIAAMFVSVISGSAPVVFADNPAPALASPVVGTATATGAEVAFYFDGATEEAAGIENRVTVKGDFSGWSELDLTKGDNEIWSLTRQIDAGWYGYGLVSYQEAQGETVGTWISDPLNTTVTNGNNPGLAVPGIRLDTPTEVLIGSTTVISSVYFTGNQDETAAVSLELADAVTGVEIDGNDLIVSEDAEPGTIELIASHNGQSVVREIEITDELLASPVVNGDGTVTFNVVYGGPTLFLVGSLNGWDINTAIALADEDHDGVFSVALPLGADVYEYKFVPTLGSWDNSFTDPLNAQQSSGNSKAVVPGILFGLTDTIATGTEFALSAALLDTGGGTPAAITPDWSIKEPVTGMSIVDGKLAAGANAPVNGSVTVVAAYGGYTAEKVIHIVGIMNTFTLNYYRFDNTPDDWNLWLWPDGANGTGYTFSETTADGYAKGVYSFTQNEINVITRLSVDGNDWSQQEVTRKVAVQSGNAVEAWIIEGIPTVYYSKPDVNEIIPVNRAIRFKYVRDDADYTDWNIWTWNTGKADGEILFDTFENDTANATIPIGALTNKIGFKLRKGSDWNTAIVDQNFDREIVTGTEVLTKVVVTGGQGEFRTLPAASAPVLADGGATFYYRDQTLFAEDDMDLIEGVKLKIGGAEYPMTYDAEDERFVYKLSSLAVGTHAYTYLITKAGETVELTDPVNTVDGQSVIVYAKPKVTIASEVAPYAISYNENAVLSLDIAAEDYTPITSIYADLSSIGGSVNTVIDPQLNELTIAVKDMITSGLKTITVTAIDPYGNKHIHKAKVRVRARTTIGGQEDFDFDEARIYFMLTDRFFDGDASNNDPNGENYDTDHLETYHGGDFKGITQKMDYLDELGINTIWITPIVDNIDFNKGIDFNSSQYGYHGYWAKDFTSIDEHLGELNDFKEMIDAAHDRGIKVMVDVVLNHTGYGLDAVAQGWENVANLPTEAEREVFAGMLREEDEDPVVRYSLALLPDLKTEEPAVREKIVAWQTDWIEKATTDKGNTIDYFRVDTVKHVENTTWMAFKNALTKVKPDFKLIGENFGASANNDGGYLRSGMMDSELDFRFKGIAHDFVDGKIASVEQELEQRNGLLDNTATFGQFLGSHDEEGFLISLLSEEDQVKFHAGTLEADKLAAVQGKQKIAASLQITAKGQPVIYYGEELGQSGVKAEDMAAGEFSENRYDLNWDGLNDPTYRHIFDHYKKLLTIREEYSKVFSKGTRTHVAGDDAAGYTVFERAYKGQSLFVGISTKTDAQQATFAVPYAAGTVVKELYSGSTVIVSSSGQVTVTLPSSLDGGTVVVVGPATEVSGGSAGGGTGGGTAGTVETATQTEVTAEVTGQAGQWTTTIDSALLGPAIEAAAKAGSPVTVNVPGVAAGEAADVRIAIAMLEKAKSAGVDLVIAFDGMSITIPAGAIASASLGGADYAVVTRSLVEQAEADQVKAGIKESDAGYSTISAVYSFKITLVSADGTVSQYVDGFAEKVQAAIELSAAELASITDKQKVGAYYAAADGTLEFKGGKLNGSTLTFETDHFSNYVVLEYSKSFADVKEGWAKSYIELLASRHITTGLDESHFNPEGTVTRGQFAVFLGRALGLKEAAYDGAFSDVKAEQYYAGYVTTLKKLGILDGYSDGTFKPSAPITREQLAAMIMRAYAHVNRAAAGGSAAGATAFADLASASPYAAASIEQASALGIINGVGDNRFAPKATATREQAAKMLIELLLKTDQL